MGGAEELGASCLNKRTQTCTHACTRTHAHYSSRCSLHHSRQSSDPLQIRGASIRRQGAGITAAYTFADEQELPGGGRVRVLSGPSARCVAAAGRWGASADVAPRARNPPPEEGGLENVVWTHESIWSLDAVCELFYEDAEGVARVVQSWGPDDRAQLGQRREQEEAAALAAAEAAKAEAGDDEGEGGEDE